MVKVCLYTRISLEKLIFTEFRITSIPDNIFSGVPQSIWLEWYIDSYLIKQTVPVKNVSSLRKEQVIGVIPSKEYWLIQQENLIKS